MKITPANAADALKQKQPPALRPLAGTDFGQHLQAQSAPAPLELPAAPALRPITALEMIPGVKGPPRPLADLNPPVTPLNPLGDSPFSLARPKPEKSEHDKIQEQARKWLAQTFYGPMLKQMRESPFKSEMFSGGRGGQAFSSMLDQRLADHMSKSTSSKLVASITRKLEANKHGGQAPAPLGGAPARPRSQPVAPANDNPANNVRIHVAPNLRA